MIKGWPQAKKKDKCHLLATKAKAAGADVVMWQEGHGFNPTSHPAFYKHKAYRCPLGQAGIMLMNEDWEVLKMAAGDNFVIVTTKVGEQSLTLVSLYLPPTRNGRLAP